MMFLRPVVLITLINVLINAQDVANLTKVSEVEEQLWRYFTEAERKAIAESMRLSTSMRITTARLYRTAYDVMSFANKMKTALYEESHSAMVHSIASTRCLEALKLTDVLQDLNDAVFPAQRCLHDFADIGAEYEKEISRLVAEMRAYTVEAIRSIKFCKLQEILFKPCSVRIVNELKTLSNLYLNKITKIKDIAINKNARYNSVTKSCLRRLRRQVVKVKTAQNDVRKCKS